MAIAHGQGVEHAVPGPRSSTAWAILNEADRLMIRPRSLTRSRSCIGASLPMLTIMLRRESVEEPDP